MVPEKFTTTPDNKGNIYLYPQGDTTVRPRAKIPEGGYYFDALIRQESLNEKHLCPKEWVNQQYSVFSEKTLKYLEKMAETLYRNTSLSIVGEFIDAGFGDIALVPGLAIRQPKGTRNPEEWYMAHIIHSEYIKRIFELQCEIALKNLELSYQAVGGKIDVIMVSGTDFGTQDGPFISKEMYREFYKPVHKKVNDWIHQNTPRKIFYHSCGSVVTFLDDFIEAGVDILNPVQCSAKGMDPRILKEKHGEKLVFWGGGVDTQRTLPFGTPEQVKREVGERCRIFGKAGDYVYHPQYSAKSPHPEPYDNV